MYLKKKDVRMFTDDPLEFIRRDGDPIDCTSRQSAVDLVIRACSFKAPGKKKKKCKDMLRPMLVFAGKVLDA